MGMDVDQPARQDHPGNAVHDLPDDVRDHHGGAGRRLGRRSHALLGLRVVRGRLAARRLCADRALGLGRRLPRQARACSISPAAPSCISTPASPASSPRYVLGTRHGYGTRQSRAVRSVARGDRHRPACGSAGSASTAARRWAPIRAPSIAIVATHLAACAGALTWMVLEWWTRGKPSVLGMISGAVAGLGTITPASGFVLPWHGVVIGIDRRRGLLLGLHLAQAASSATTIRSTCSASTASAARPARCSPACSRPRRCRSARLAGRAAGAARGQSAAGADPALRRRRRRWSGRAC